MAKYINREDVMSIVYDIRPTDYEYHHIGVGVAEEMVLDAKKEIAEMLEKLPSIEIED